VREDGSQAGLIITLDAGGRGVDGIKGSADSGMSIFLPDDRDDEAVAFGTSSRLAKGSFKVFAKGVISGSSLAKRQQKSKTEALKHTEKQVC